MRTLCKEKTDTTEGTIKNRQYRDIDNNMVHKTQDNDKQRKTVLDTTMHKQHK